MKAMILLVGLVTASVSQAAQFQFYPQWNTDRSDVTVSTAENPQPGYLFTAKNHICYYGAQEDALPLMQVMIDLANGGDAALELREFEWTVSPKYKKPVIRFVIYDAITRSTWTAPSIPQCVRQIK